MAKWCGIIGYIKTEEIERGRWQESDPVNRTYYGDIIKNHTRIQSDSGSTNSNITINNNISIVSDDFAIENFRYMKYIEFKGTLWNISDVEEQRPRLIITLGGIYNAK